MILTESNFMDVEVLTEDTNGHKNFYIEGVFLQADVVNKNRRMYPLGVMQESVGRYDAEYVRQSRAVGELGHPDTMQVNLDRITHLTETIRQDGANFIGRAKILNTPSGNIAKGLMEGGVKIGVSSRASGSVKRNSQGINEVQEDLQFGAIDIVYQPSAPDAFVEGLMEGAEYIYGTIQEDCDFVEQLRKDMDSNAKYKLQEAKIEAFQKFLNHIKSKS